MRDDYLKQAQEIIPDPNILINVVSRRAKQLKFGNKPLVESLEKLDSEDIALREIIEGKISYVLGEEDEEFTQFDVPTESQNIYAFRDGCVYFFSGRFLIF